MIKKRGKMPLVIRTHTTVVQLASSVSQLAPGAQRDPDVQIHSPKVNYGEKCTRSGIQTHNMMSPRQIGALLDRSARTN